MNLPMVTWNTAEFRVLNGIAPIHQDPAFNSWKAMRARCYDANNGGYANYGGRGITVCERWRESFANFRSDMGPRPSDAHSIERIAVDGQYSPENCKWATQKEQCRNKRNNHLLTAFGETKTLADWAEDRRCMVSRATLRVRAIKGWPGELVVTKPPSRGATHHCSKVPA